MPDMNLNMHHAHYEWWACLPISTPYLNPANTDKPYQERTAGNINYVRVKQ
jgi:hypothetical protein